MTQEEKKWLIINRDRFFETNIPALQILDSLVMERIFAISEDDYQIIKAERTSRGQIRELLDALPSKSGAALHVFADSLQRLCPHVLRACTPRPAKVLEKLDEELRSHFKAFDQEELRAFSWLVEDAECPPIRITNYIRHLAVVGKSRADQMISEQIASSATEGKRSEYLYSNAEKHEFVQLENIFDDLDSGRLSKCGENIATSNVASAQPPSNRSGAVVSGQEARSLSKPPRWLVGIYGGAGCGKTSSILKLYSLYAREQLWRNRFKLVLFWRLRDPEVQQSETFEQLLSALPRVPSRQRPTDLAKALLVSEGEGVLVVLDGVDELEATGNAFVRKLLDGSALPKACVIATSRPCGVARDYFRHYNTTSLELLGFTEKQVETFVQQRLGHKPDALAKLRDVLTRNVSLAALMIVPLLSFMVCDVFSVSSDNPPTTRTQLYSKLLVLVVQRALADKRDGQAWVAIAFSSGEMDALLAVDDVQQFEGKAKQLLLEVAQVAYHAHKADRAIFDQTLVRSAGCSSDALKLGLLVNHGQKQVGRRLLAQYSFQHLTVQEFLVAFLLADQITSATPENREQTLREKMNDLGMGPHQLVVVQFLAGLLPAHLHHVFFTILNDWLHHNWSWMSERCEDRLRACLHCAREACGEDAFPANLQLPKKVRLEHVTASDLEVLSSAMNKCPSSVEELWLDFDKVEGEVEERRFSRVQTQTKLAVEKLMSVLSTHTSLRKLLVSGPKYKLFTERSWRCLVETVHNNPLSVLDVPFCCLEDDEVIELSIELEHNTQLIGLYLNYNMISDRGVRRLADVLTHNHTVSRLHLHGNRLSAESAEYVKRQLTHLTPGGLGLPHLLV